MLQSIQEISNASFVITWSEPSVKNGKLLNYNFSINSNGPLYDVPQDKECYVDKITSSYIRNADVNILQFNQSAPFHSYNISIKVSTSAGYGPSNSFTVMTSEGRKCLKKNICLLSPSLSTSLITLHF